MSSDQAEQANPAASSAPSKTTIGAQPNPSNPSQATSPEYITPPWWDDMAPPTESGNPSSLSDQGGRAVDFDCGSPEKPEARSHVKRCRHYVRKKAKQENLREGDQLETWEEHIKNAPAAGSAGKEKMEEAGEEELETWAEHLRREQTAGRSKEW